MLFILYYGFLIIIILPKAAILHLFLTYNIYPIPTFPTPISIHYNILNYTNSTITLTNPN